MSDDPRRTDYSGPAFRAPGGQYDKPAVPDSPTFVKFNPTDSPDVDYIKARTDALISFVKSKARILGSGDAARRAMIAADRYEEAAMWAVKSLFSGSR